MQERAWKPNLLVPVSDERVLRGISMILQALAAPNGSLKIIGLGHNEEVDLLVPPDGERTIAEPAAARSTEADHDEPPVSHEEARATSKAGAPSEKNAERAARQDTSEDPRRRKSRPGAEETSEEEKERSAKRRQNVALSERLTEMTHSFRRHGIFASSTVIDAGGYAEGLVAGMQAMRGTFFKPNVVFLEMPEDEARKDDLRLIVREADREGIGTLLYAPHRQANLGQRRSINVWIHDRSPDWRIKMKIGNLDLMVLTAYKLAQNWNARLRLITVVDSDEKEEKARDFMEQLRDLGRFSDAEVCVGRGGFADYLREAPQADLSVFGLLPEPDFGFCRRMVHETRSTCLFVRDSGEESALA